LSKLSGVMNKSIEDTEERNKKSLEMLKDTQERLVKLGEDSLSDFSSAAKNVISDSLSELEQLSATISQRVSQVGSEIVKSNEKLFEDLSEKVEQALSIQMSSVTEQIETSFKEALNASKKFSVELETTNKNIKSLGNTTARVTKNISNMEFFVPDIEAMGESQDKYISNLELLSSEVESKTRSLMKVEHDMQNHMSSVAEGYEKVINSYQEVISSSKASQLVDEESKLLEALKSRAESIDVLAKQWDIDVRAMAEYSRDFSENLVMTAKFITNEMQTPAAVTPEVVNG
jgi:DNA-binding ferritin-like protein